MNIAEKFADRLNEVLLTGKWVTGTNLKDELGGLNWKQATAQVDTLNTIALLTFHIHYYLAGVLQVLEGGDLTIRDKYSFDAPPVQNETDWMNLVDRFIRDSERFVELVNAMPDEKLNETFVKKEYGSFARNLDVMIEHAYYHFGQIVLLKKLIGSK